MSRCMDSAICGVLLIAATCLTGCNSVTDDGDGVEITLNTTRNDNSTFSKVVSKADADNVPGRVLFWKASQVFGTVDFLYFYSDIDNLAGYSTTKYNTGQTYPSDGTLVYAAGYSPVKTITASTDYKTLTVADVNAGTVDVLTSSVPIQGSKNNEFSGDLTFDHTLTKITFKAQFDYTMYQIRQIENIRVDVPNNYLPVQWGWNTTNNKYEVQSTVLKSTSVNNGILQLQHPAALASQDLAEEIGTCYLNLPSGNVGKLKGIALTIDLYKYGSTTSLAKDQKYENITIQLAGVDGEYLTTDAVAGQSYEVIFKFSNDNWTLAAYQQPWADGGLLIVPVDPKGN